MRKLASGATHIKGFIIKFFENCINGLYKSSYIKGLTSNSFQKISEMGTRFIHWSIRAEAEDWAATKPRREMVGSQIGFFVTGIVWRLNPGAADLSRLPVQNLISF